MTENEMVRQHHGLNGHEFEQTLRESGRNEPGVLQSMELQSDRHDLTTEQLQMAAVLEQACIKHWTQAVQIITTSEFYFLELSCFKLF